MALLLVFVCVCVCVHTRTQAYLGESVRTHMQRALLCVCVCVSPCVCSWWLCARQTAFICININTRLSRSPSHSCPLVQSVRGWPLSSCWGCRWTRRTGRWARRRGQTVRLDICRREEKVKVRGRHTRLDCNYIDLHSLVTTHIYRC